jgi:hypothetical protein
LARLHAEALLLLTKKFFGRTVRCQTGGKFGTGIGLRIAGNEPTPGVAQEVACRVMHFAESFFPEVLRWPN